MKTFDKIGFKKMLQELYCSLPKKQKTYANRCLFKSMLVDRVMIKDVVSSKKEVMPVIKTLKDFDCNNVIESLESLKQTLDVYYSSRIDDGRYEKEIFDKLRSKEPIPTFILSYNRPIKNGTLRILEDWGDQEVFDNTLVFVQPEQEAEYKRNHPQFGYYAKGVKSVGERFGAVVDFCKKWGIRYALIMEDDLSQFLHIKKGGVNSGSHLATKEQSVRIGGSYIKYIGYTGMKIMKDNPDVVMVGVRNRVMANNESTSIIGYHEPMRGGCPNMIHFLDIERFYPIWKTIPSEHYTPQSDWAIQCAVVSQGKQWAMITGVVKDEKNSKSVIGFTGDREELAKEYLKYYNVEDKMSYRKFKETERQGVKLFYNSRKKEQEYESL